MPRLLRIAICLVAFALATGLVAFRSDRDPNEVAPSSPPANVLRAPGPVLKPVPSTPIAEEKAILGDDETWRPQWDGMIEKSLPPDLLKPEMGHKVRQFCPRFSRMSEADRRAFWAYFFQALSAAESGLNRTSNVQHTEPQVAVVDRVSHRMVHSEGLLQLTYEDSARYGCDFDWEHDRKLPAHDPRKTILQPKNNLLCGVNILENQLISQRKPLLSMSSYWSTLRPAWPGNRVFMQQMKNVPAACGVKGPVQRETTPEPANTVLTASR